MSTLVAALTTTALLLYFLAMDVLVGGTLVAINARARGTLNHRRLFVRLGHVLPLAVLATAALGAATIALLHARDGIGVSTSMMPAGIADRTTVPRLLHIVLAAVAVTGLLLAEAGIVLGRGGEVFGRWLARHGAVWMVCATLANLLVGGWWIVRLPHDTMIRFTGADTRAMLTFSAGLIAAILALGFGAMSTTVPDPRRYLHATSAMLAITLVAMVLMREELRPAAAPGAGDGTPWSIALAVVLLTGGVYVLSRAARTFLAGPAAQS